MTKEQGGNNGDIHHPTGVLNDLSEGIDDQAAAELAQKHGINIPERFESPNEGEGNNVIDTADRFTAQEPPEQPK